MSEEKKFPTPSTPKAQEEKLSPEKKEAILNAFREKLRKYYTTGTMSFEHKMGMDEKQDK